MSIEDKEKLSKQMQEQVYRSFELDEFIFYTLNSFAYRYLESDSTGKAEARKVHDFAYTVQVQENNFRTFQKTKHKPTLELLKLRPSSVIMGINVEFNGDLKNGTCKVTAFVSSDQKNTPLNEATSSSIEKTFQFEDILDLRNTFALHLEEVCEVF